MWARCGNTVGYLGFAEILPAIQPGERIRIEGTTNGSDSNTRLSGVRITRLPDPVVLVPVDARDRLGDASALHAQFVTIRGLVDRQIDKDVGHATLDIVAEGRLVTVWLPHATTANIPHLEGAIVEATGVFCATANPAGQLTKLELCVNSPAAIATVGWLANDPRFASAPVAIQDLATAGPDSLVHIAGIARAVQPGKSVTLRDDTAQVDVLTPQTHGIQLGDPLEAVGYPHNAGTDWQFSRSLIRRSQQPLPAARGLPRLRLATQLRELATDAAARGYPVQLSGVVTWSHPDSDFFFLLDASGGACIRKLSPQQEAPSVGEKLDIVGVSEAGDFAPVVAATSLYRSGRMDLPDARPVTLEQALTGVEEAQWIAMSGFVRDILVDGPWARLEIGTAAGTFIAILPKTAPSSACAAPSSACAASAAPWPTTSASSTASISGYPTPPASPSRIPAPPTLLRARAEHRQPPPVRHPIQLQPPRPHLRHGRRPASRPHAPRPGRRRRPARPHSRHHPARPRRPRRGGGLPRPRQRPRRPP
jgi:hypothetical protein